MRRDSAVASVPCSSVSPNVSEGRDAATCVDALAARVRRSAARRARRRRPPPVGVHARRARPRDAVDAPRVRSPTPSPSTSRSPATTACTRGSARSTSCRSSRSEDAPKRERARPRTARDFARWWPTTLDVPVFLYDDADPEDRDLPRLRRDAFRAPRARLRARRARTRRSARRRSAPAARSSRSTACSTRDDVALARRSPHDVRERDGGLPGVRALGFVLARRDGGRRCR